LNAVTISIIQHIQLIKKTSKNWKLKPAKRYPNSPKRKPNVPNRKKSGKNILDQKVAVND